MIVRYRDRQRDVQTGTYADKQTDVNKLYRNKQIL